MFDYLQQFNSLPKDLKDKVSSPQAMANLTEIENRYQVDLAMIVMKVMIKSLAIKDLPAVFVGEFSLSPVQAEEITKELKEKIFKLVADYVGLTSELKELDLNRDINLLIKEAGLTIPSEFLVERLKKIIATYLKGVRSRIDTKESLAKDITTGGLGLSVEESDRVLKVCDSQKFKYHESASAYSFASPPGSRLDKIISTNEKTKAAPLVEYDLKRALASGETKSLAAPQTGEKLPTLTSDTNKTQNSLVAQTTTPISTAPISTAPISNPSISTASAIQKPAQDQGQTSLPSSQAVAGVTASGLGVKPPLSGPGIVRKPENTSLLKKLFNEDQKPSSPELAKTGVAAKTRDVQSETVSTSKGATSQPLTPSQSSSPLSTSAHQSSVASARLKTNTNIDSLSRNKVAPLTNQSTVSMNRPRVQDVRVVPKVMGPLEELQFLDLTNFRRLGKTPEEITMKIFNKIKLLEREGYEKMIAGIIAWKKSPVSLLYLKMVQEAINSGKTLKESVALRQEKQNNVLSMEEIEAIMSFNSKLVF